MTDVVAPVIHGSDWKPGLALEFPNSLPADAARSEVLRFIAERHDGHLQIVAAAWDHIHAQNGPKLFNGFSWQKFTNQLVEAISRGLGARLSTLKLGESVEDEVIPRRDFSYHLNRRTKRFILDLRLCLRRLAHYMSITTDQRKKWQRLMTRTRALDEHLKQLFMEGLPTSDGGKFTGKGFRSTWQEGVVAVASALNRVSGDDNINLPSGGSGGDIVAPMIRDVGLSLAMGDSVLGVMSAQMGKSSSNQNGGWDEIKAGGRDLHIGAWSHGVLPPTAPLPIATGTLTGVALAAKFQGLERFHVACIGEGASSSGEWWESVNFAGTRGLPITYILQNNQIALDTPSNNQSGVELWADKAIAMGIPSWTIDGSDPAAWYASVATAREFSTRGGGATLIHVETMRGCGHAHHHDDLYLGTPSGNPPGYVDRDTLSYWEAKDPLPTHRQLLLDLGISDDELSMMEDEEQSRADAARKQLNNIPWPDPETVTLGVTSIHDAETHSRHIERLKSGVTISDSTLEVGELDIEFSSASDSWTYSRAIQQAMVTIADRYSDSIIFMGEDMEIAGAFGMNLAIKNAGHEDRLLDMPLSEACIIHSATGAALAGMRPVAEIQFGGFAALGFNALINNAAMLRWRWGAEVPLTVRIPLGGRTRSGPFHANMIESWFSNDPGLIILAPSTPQDAYDLLVEAAELPDPVLYLEHIGLYGLRGGVTGWGDNINQIVDNASVQSAIESEQNYKIGKAAVIRGGRDVTVITWGAMLHVALKAADELAEQDIQLEVVDLRTLIPFDADTCVASVARTGRLMVLQEGQWTGGLGHSVQSRILEEAFWCLEAPPIVVGALDTPVPFSPTLEDYTIPSVEFVIETAKVLIG